MHYHQELVHHTDVIATISEAIASHESKKCRYLRGLRCSCEPYRNALTLAEMERQEIEDVNAELVDGDITQAIEELHGV